MLKRIVLAMLLALFVAVPVLAHSSPVALRNSSVIVRVHHHRPGCSKLFTIAEGKRAADVIYRGTRTVTRRNLRLLGRIEHCQRNPRAKKFMRWYDHNQATLHVHRVYDASHPYSGGWFTEYFPGGGGQEGGLGYSCGGSYVYGDMVVANAQLACGTKVQLQDNGHTVVAIVEDRFGASHPVGNFDLTPAVADRLGCTCSEPGQWRIAPPWLTKVG